MEKSRTSLVKSQPEPIPTESDSDESDDVITGKNPTSNFQLNTGVEGENDHDVSPKPSTPPEMFVAPDANLQSQEEESHESMEDGSMSDDPKQKGDQEKSDLQKDQELYLPVVN